MMRALSTTLTKAFPDAPWLHEQPVSRDIVVELSIALGPAWDVMREIDYVGECSIVALPVGDIDAMPALILYEADGQAHVAIVRDDVWEAVCGFSSLRQAMNSMIDAGALLVRSRASN